MYKAEELYATIHLPLMDTLNPNDSGNADEVALDESSSTTVVCAEV